MPHKTLLITDRDVSKAISMREAIALVEKAFAAHARGRSEMPPKIYLNLKRYNGDFRAMPAYVSGIEACGVKWVNVHPGNIGRKLPSVMATIILSDPATGEPLAVMDATRITNMRTGAAGAVAAKHLARKRSSVVALFGCGTQARHQLDGLTTLFRIKLLRLFDEDASRSAIIKRYAKGLGMTAIVAASARECVSNADIVVTTTPSRTARIKDRWISPGTHINAIGADAKGKEELEASLLKRSKVVVDDICQAMHSGEINVPVAKKIFSVSDIHATIGEIITGRASGRVSEGEITVFDSTGLAIQDMAVAHRVYSRLRGSASVGRISFR